MDLLKARLKEMGPDHAQDFHDIAYAYGNLADKYGLWSAVKLIGHSSNDGFVYFRSWLISQGRDRPAYEAGAKHSAPGRQRLGKGRLFACH